MEQSTQQLIDVVIVDDIRETRDNLEKLLLFENDIQVVGNAGSAIEGIELVHKLHPDIVLMDINMPEMDGITATERICSETLGVSVIMISVLGDQDHLRRSMVAGAREFLTKPFGSEELTNAIRRVHQLDAGKKQFLAGTPVRPAESVQGTERPLGKIISCFSPKGGVGCTTLVTNLAVALRFASEKRIALVDCSLLFGDVGVMLNLVSDKTVCDLGLEVQQIDDGLLNEVLATHSSGVKVLLAPPRPQMAELITPEHVRRILLRLQQDFDYVLVDTWPSFHEIVLSVLDLSDQILFVMTLEMPSIKDTRLFLEVADLLNYSSDKLLLILNRADISVGIRVQDIETALKHRLTATIPSNLQAVTLAMNQGIPLVIGDKSNPISKSISSLADLLLSKEKPGPVTGDDDRPSEAGLVPRLRATLHFPNWSEKQIFHSVLKG